MNDAYSKSDGHTDQNGKRRVFSKDNPLQLSLFSSAEPSQEAIRLLEELRQPRKKWRRVTMEVTRRDVNSELRVMVEDDKGQRRYLDIILKLHAFTPLIVEAARYVENEWQ